MTLEQFKRWIRKAEHGDSVVYHQGVLMRDRQLHKDPKLFAEAAYEAYERGEVALVQKRISPVSCAYIAQRIRRKSLVGFSDFQ